MMVEAEIWTIAQTEGGNAVLLKPKDMELVVPIFIGQVEAQAILFGLGNVTVSRPLTHDLFQTLTRQMRLELLRVEVWDLKDNTFYGRLLYTGGDFSEEKPLVLDARPSDALALAVRGKRPIFIAEKVIDETALPSDFFLDLSAEFAGENAPETPSRGSSSAEKKRREALLRELEQAVEAEEYELAAKIRDILSDKDAGDF
jgi:bifunctional DNase/RNase